MTASVVVLGATGSIGRQTLDVAERLGIAVTGVACATPGPEIVDIARRHPDARVAVAGGSSAERAAVIDAIGNRARFGPDAVLELASEAGDCVVNGVVGCAGLPLTWAAVRAGKRVALANKESLVAAGRLVLDEALRRGATVIPVDSEHSALHQLVDGRKPDHISSLVLTASGGPFRGRPADSLEEVTPAEALRHPTWSMGGRISIDSATLVNKGLEVIEAHVLFGVPFDRIEVVVHPQSLVHSLVRLADGALLAHIGHTDMRVPIQYALTYPERLPLGLGTFDLTAQPLLFEAPDRSVFPALDLAYAAGRAGGTLPVVYNAADEVAVAAFLQGRLGFTGIARLIEQAMSLAERGEPASVADVIEADREARALAASLVAGVC